MYIENTEKIPKRNVFGILTEEDIEPPKTLNKNQRRQTKNKGDE